jgi:coenzyme PQQ precursor peptide PqqA
LPCNEARSDGAWLYVANEIQRRDYLGEVSGTKLHARKEVMIMQWLAPDFDEFDCAGEVTMYVYHW